METWPSIAAYGAGRAIGRLLAIRWPNLYIFRLGVLLAPVFIPVALLLYFYRLAPSFFGLPLHGSFYRLTNRRVLELRNEFARQPDASGRKRFRFIYGAEVKSVALDRFDVIDIERLPGQEWYDAGNLIFREGTTETLRLEGVSRPEAFRHACWKAHMAYVGVKKALEREALSRA